MSQLNTLGYVLVIPLSIILNQALSLYIHNNPQHRIDKAIINNLYNSVSNGDGTGYINPIWGHLQSSSNRRTNIASQKHILEKERFIWRKGPKGFQTIAIPVDDNSSNRTKELADEFKSKLPNASIGEIWAHFKYTGTLRKGMQSGKLHPSKWAKRPNYYKTGLPKYVEYPREKDMRGEEDVRGTIKTPDEIEGIRKACRIAREILDSVYDLIVEGTMSDEIDRRIHRMCEIKKVFPSTLNYHGFPKSCCVSINEVACHGIPDSTVLSAGDLVNVDFTVYVDGFHGDLSETFMVLPIKDPSKAKKRKLPMGMYEANKMRFHALGHNNLYGSDHAILSQLALLKFLHSGVMRLNKSDGWTQLFDYMNDPEDQNRRQLFHSHVNTPLYENLRDVGIKLANDILEYYQLSTKEGAKYDGRIIGLQRGLYPTYTDLETGGKIFRDIEDPNIAMECLNSNDPERYYKPYIYSHSFDIDVELMKVTYEAMMEAINLCKPGVSIKTIGRIISLYAESRGFSVLPNLFGHGIGRNFHEYPHISHVPNENDVVLEPGMVFTIEPILTRTKNTEFVMWPDGWTIAMSNGSKTAQFEHTILITENGPEILTKRLPSSPPLYWEDPIKVRY